MIGRVLLGLGALAATIAMAWWLWSLSTWPPNAAHAVENGVQPREALEDKACWFEARGRSDCFWFVPTQQDADDATSLPVVVLGGRSARAGSVATIYLMGGPGGASWLDSDGIPNWRDWIARLGIAGDVVFYDQRGTGYAYPDLACDGFVDVVRADYAAQGDTPDAQREFGARYEAAAQDCAEIVDEADRAAGLYSTATARDDLIELMQQLESRRGYRGFALYGASYGSRLAIETAQAAPLGLVKRVVLDGFYANGTDLLQRTPLTLVEVAKDFDAWCAADPACGQPHARFEARLQAALERARTQPRRHRVDNAEYDEDHPELDVYVDATMLLGLVTMTLAGGDDPAALLARLDEIAAGQWTPAWDQIARDAAYGDMDTSFNSLAYTLIECRDNPVPDDAAYAAVLRQAPQYAQLLAPVEGEDDACATLGVTAAPLPTTPTNVDALVVSMQVEPITPVRVARAGLARLRHAQWRVVRGVGHIAADHDDCAAKAIGAYINRGDLDAWKACALVESAAFEHGVQVSAGLPP